MQLKKIFIIPLLLIILVLGIITVKWQLSKQILTDTMVNNSSKTYSMKVADKIPEGAEINILIDKSDFQLHVYVADTIVKSYSVVLGGNPVDDKLQQGDECTPEGTFKMRSKYPHKSWSKFIWINYPTADSWKKHKKAKADGIIPKEAKIGGEIGIHGVPKGTDYMIKDGVNWTLGCISLTNEDINELYPLITNKTNITIQK